MGLIGLFVVLNFARVAMAQYAVPNPIPNIQPGGFINPSGPVNPFLPQAPLVSEFPSDESANDNPFGRPEIPANAPPANRTVPPCNPQTPEMNCQP